MSVSLSACGVRVSAVPAGVHAVYEAVCEIVTERPDEKRKIKKKERKVLNLTGPSDSISRTLDGVSVKGNNGKMPARRGGTHCGHRA